MRYALALGGGGARCAFQAGVWRALSEMGKDVAAIAGTSAGAINGAVFASGGDGDTLWNKISSEGAISAAQKEGKLPSKMTEVLFGMLGDSFDIEPLRQLLTEHISEDRLRTSGIEFGLCVYSANRMRAFNFFSDEIEAGKLIDYVLASSCLPAFKPVRIWNSRFYDGGIRNNLPVDMLISRGWRNIITVPVHGAGLTRDVNTGGVNIIEIKSRVPEGGILDFGREAVGRSIKSGYLECKRAFGLVSGTEFFINSESYNAAQNAYGRSLIDGVERAADMIGLDKHREYTFSELANAVVSLYENNAQLIKAVKFIQSNGIFHNKQDFMGDLYEAANAVICLKKR